MKDWNFEEDEYRRYTDLALEKKKAELKRKIISKEFKLKNRKGWAALIEHLAEQL